jgi:hypothetical protein
MEVDSAVVFRGGDVILHNVRRKAPRGAG